MLTYYLFISDNFQQVDFFQILRILEVFHSFFKIVYDFIQRLLWIIIFLLLCIFQRLSLSSAFLSIKLSTILFGLFTFYLLYAKSPEIQRFY